MIDGKEYLDREDNYKRIERISVGDVAQLREKGESYGDSWKKRGGVGAFMMLARKWDRMSNTWDKIESAVENEGWDVFKACGKYVEKDGILDDIGDLRRYLLLIEAYMEGIGKNGNSGKL